MYPSGIEDWLAAQAKAQAADSLAFAAGCALLGMAVLAVTAAAAYALVWFTLEGAVAALASLFLDKTLTWPSILPLSGTVLLLGLLFWANARKARLHRAPERQSPATDPGLGRSLRRRALVSLLAYPGASADAFEDLLYTAPRLLGIAGRHLGRAWRLFHANLHDCARLIEVLLASSTRVPLVRLTQLPQVQDPLLTLDQLRDFDGVLFLFSPPAGLALTCEWRTQLAAHRPGDADKRLPSPDQPLAQRFPRLPTEASLGDMQSAFRQRIRAYATSRLIRQNPELQELAQQELAAINAAYEAFLARHGKKPAPQDRRDVARVWEQFRRRDVPRERGESTR